MSDQSAPAVAPCSRCGYVPAGIDAGVEWGYAGTCLGRALMDGYLCAHLECARRCDSCGQDWWMVGQKPDNDIDGCARETCPECVEADAKEKVAS